MYIYYYSLCENEKIERNISTFFCIPTETHLEILGMYKSDFIYLSHFVHGLTCSTKETTYEYAVEFAC